MNKTITKSTSSTQRSFKVFVTALSSYCRHEFTTAMKNSSENSMWKWKVEDKPRSGHDSKGFFQREGTWISKQNLQ